MGVTLHDSGEVESGGFTLTTEASLSDISTSGAYQLMIDTTNMAVGDRVRVDIYAKCLTGDTPEVVDWDEWAGVQDAKDRQKLFRIIPTDLAESNCIQFRLTWLAGTVPTAGSGLNWKVMKIG